MWFVFAQFVNILDNSVMTGEGGRPPWVSTLNDKLGIKPCIKNQDLLKHPQWSTQYTNERLNVHPHSW